MLKNKLALGVVVFLCSLHASTVSAVALEVIPDTSTMNVSDSLTVDVLISGLGVASAPSLGVFDIDLTFDPALFMAGAVTFGDQLDLLGFGSTQLDAAFPGAVNAFELSIDPRSTLDFSQADSFRLFSVEFEAISTGFGLFDLSVLSLGDSSGTPLPYTTSGASVEVLQPSVIPVPAAVWLFGTGILGLIGISKRRKAT